MFRVSKRTTRCQLDHPFDTKSMEYTVAFGVSEARTRKVSSRDNRSELSSQAKQNSSIGLSGSRVPTTSVTGAVWAQPEVSKRKPESELLSALPNEQKDKRLEVSRSVNGDEICNVRSSAF